MAGMRETGDVVERLGVERAKSEIGLADVVVLVVDDSAGPTAEDLRLLSDLGAAGKPTVVAVNKVDLGVGAWDARDCLPPGCRAVRISAKTGEGLGALEEAILCSRGGDREGHYSASVVVTNLRHVDALERAGAAIGECLGVIRNGLPVDLASAGLRDAIDALGEITGETSSDELIERIFSDFCVGK
jgi:tRNA modification GTPase